MTNKAETAISAHSPLDESIKAFMNLRQRRRNGLSGRRPFRSGLGDALISWTPSKWSQRLAALRFR
jgi:hypothetical protein